MKEILNSTEVFYCLLLKNEALRNDDINVFVNKWISKKADNSGYNDFCKKNYRLLLKGDNQRLFIENGGLKLVFDDIKAEDVSEDVWKGAGSEKVLEMSLDSAKVLLKDPTLWKYFKEGVESSKKDSLTKFKVLYKLVLERGGKDVEDVHILDSLYKDSNDDDDEWKRIITEITTNHKTTNPRNKYEGKVTLSMLKNFVPYMPKTLQEKKNVYGVMALLENFGGIAASSDSFEIINFYVSVGICDLRVIPVITILFKKASAPEKKALIRTLCDFVGKSKEKVSMNFGDLLAIEDGLMAELSDQVFFVLARTNPASNDTTIRVKLREVTEKNVDSFTPATILIALKVLYNLCCPSKYKMLSPEPQNVCDFLDSVITKKGDDISIRRMCFLFAAFLINKYDVKTPSKISAVAVENVNSDRSVPLNMLMVVLSSRGVLEPELLDGSLKVFVDNFNIEVLVHILSSANEKGSAAGKSFTFTETLIRKIFSISDFANEVKKNAKILQLLYEIICFDKRSVEFMYGVGGIRSLMDVEGSELKMKILRCALSSEESVCAFYGYGGVKQVMGILANRQKSKISSDAINDCGNILLKMCEFGEPCLAVAEGVKTVYEIATKDSSEKNQVVFSCVLSKIYYVKLGSANVSKDDIQTLMSPTKSVELMKPRLYAALYALYSSSDLQGIKLDDLKFFVSNPELDEIVKNVARVASRGDFKLSLYYHSNFV